MRQSYVLNELFRIGYGRHWGCFDTRSAALAFLTDRPRAQYDDDEIVQINLERFKQVQAFDWPVMFHMDRLIRSGKLSTITDFGGHVGVKYYAYRDHLSYPADLRWQVVDVAAACREGSRQRPGWASALSFHETIAETAPCDLLLCSGSLQYSDMSLPELLGSLKQAPRAIILNKVAIASSGFFTLEAFGRGRMPYRIFSEGELHEWRRLMGYELWARWEIPDRGFVVPSRHGARNVNCIGEAWKRQ